MAAAIKRKIENLIAKANSATGNDHTDLTSGVNALIEGYGQGESVPEWDGSYSASDEVEEIVGEDSPLPIEIPTESEMTALLATADIGSVYKYAGTTGTYENGALYVVEAVSE